MECGIASLSNMSYAKYIEKRQKDIADKEKQIREREARLKASQTNLIHEQIDKKRKWLEYEKELNKRSHLLDETEIELLERTLES